jgi:hypothetical protein
MKTLPAGGFPGLGELLQGMKLRKPTRAARAHATT